jgi:hypothetical protein
MGDAQVPIPIVIVIVVYERSLADVEAWSALARRITEDGGGFVAADGLRLERVLIYDNSSEARAEPTMDMPRVEYLHDAGNGGTAPAYARGAALAEALAVEWLLLLDHDTRLPPTFFAGLGRALRAVAEAPESHVAALVPWVQVQDGAVASPTRVTRNGTFSPLRRGQTIDRGMHISGLASGTVLHVPTLVTILPAPRGLWLDYVDHWLFAQLHRRQLSTAIYEEVLTHDLSVSSLGTLRPARLRSILDGELQFHRLLGPLARRVYPFRLAARVLRLAVVNPALVPHAIDWMVGVGFGRRT